MVFSIVCGFIDRLIRYTGSPKMTRSHAMCSIMMSTVTSNNWRQGWKSEELRTFGSEVCEFKTEVLELFSLVCKLELYAINFHSLEHLVENVRRFGGLSLFDVSSYE